MKKKSLAIGISMIVVILLTLTSFSNVVGYQTVQTSQQKLIIERINQREMLFQTICDIANNKEIQRIVLKSQMSRGIFPTSEIPVLTKNQLKMMYFIGLLLSKFISKTKMQSMIQHQNQIINPKVQQEISAVVEKNPVIKGEIAQLQNSKYECENDNTTRWTFPIICDIFNYTITAMISFSYGFLGMYVYYWLIEHNKPILTKILDLFIDLIIYSVVPIFILGFFLGCFEIEWPP